MAFSFSGMPLEFPAFVDRAPVSHTYNCSGRSGDISVLVSVFAHILVPLIALVAVAVIQFDKGVAMPAQIAEGGTDLLHAGDRGHRKYVHQSQIAREIWAGVDGAHQHHDRARHNYFGGDVGSCKSLADGAA